jgi:hypothetical protein
MNTKEINYFFERIMQQDDCWVWTGTLTTKGYGRFNLRRTDGVRWRAHRWAYEYFVSEIPNGLTLDHLCRNKACVNPYHLDPVPASINSLRYQAGDNTLTKARDWTNGNCKNGHSLNTWGFVDRKKKDGKVSRECKGCRKEQSVRYYRSR